jgi:tetratricopeptide (TPR) repeat protein
MRILVGLAALVAAGVVAGVVLATRQDPSQPKAICATPSPKIVAGVSSKRIAAVRAAFAKPPKQAALALEPLVQESPKDPVVVFNDALALFCAGYPNEATQAFLQAKKVGYDTYYEVESDVLLHPQYFQGSDGEGGYPPFLYTGSDPLLLRGQIEQRAYHQHSAEKLWARDAKLHPNDPDAQVAAAVGRFDMSDLNASFSRLGPLVKRFPKSQSVRFHLGLLLIWIGEGKQAKTELQHAVALGPHTALGQQAAKLLTGLVPSGTNGAKR